MPLKISALFAAVIGGSWAFLAYQAWQMTHLPMSEMWMPPSVLSDWEANDFAWVLSMWAVMMAAMMLPSAWPMLQAFYRYCKRDKAQASETRVLYFAGAYLAVWLLFSVVLTVMQWLFHGWAWLSPMMENRQPLVAAGILGIAGVYQFTAFKNACLHHCRSPFSYLLQHWRPGNKGAFEIGFKHGMSCLGCCWAQMLIMFAVGVMSLAGMLMISLIVIVEKSAPIAADKLSRGIGLFLLFWGGYCLSGVIFLA